MSELFTAIDDFQKSLDAIDMVENILNIRQPQPEALDEPMEELL